VVLKVDGQEEWKIERPLGKFEFITTVYRIESDKCTVSSIKIGHERKIDDV